MSSELLYEWRFTANHYVLATSPLRLTTSNFIFQLNTCDYSPHVTSFLDGSVVCNCCWPSPAQSFSGQSPAGRMTAFYFLRFETPPTWGSGPRIYIPRNRVAQLYPQALGFLFVASYNSQGYGGGIRPLLRRGWNSSESESESYVTTDGQSASLSWNKAPIWGLWPDFYYCQTVAGLLMWGALSDERTSPSFTIAAGPRQRSHSRVRFLWDLRPYSPVSDSRLPFSSPPTTRRATVEIFDPASTRVGWRKFSVLAKASSNCKRQIRPSMHECSIFHNCHVAGIEDTISNNSSVFTGMILFSDLLHGNDSFAAIRCNGTSLC
jgi:hypothetical protein